MAFHHQPCYMLTLWFEVTISKKLCVSLLLNSWLQLVEQYIEKFYRNSVEILMFLSFAFTILFHTSLICIVWSLIQNFVKIVDIEMNYIERYKVENIFQKISWFWLPYWKMWEFSILRLRWSYIVCYLIEGMVFHNGFEHLDPLLEKMLRCQHLSLKIGLILQGLQITKVLHIWTRD